MSPEREIPTIHTARKPVTDVLHGQHIVDPYRWLEDADSPETRAWTDGQAERTRKVLDRIPGRQAIERQMREYLAVGSVSDVRLRGNRLFLLRRSGDQEQSVLFVRDGLDGEDRALLDPATHGDAGLVAMDWWSPSPDGSLVAVGLSEGGDEWSTLHVIDVATGQELDDRIPRARGASPAWLPDSSGFYYSRYPQPGDVPSGEDNYHRRVRFHRIGTDASDDPVMFGEGRPREDMLVASIDPTGRWVVVEANHGWSKTEIYVFDRQDEDAGFRDITPEGTSVHDVIGFRDGAVFNVTTWNAPSGQVLRLDLESGRGWSTVVPERDGCILHTAAVTKDGIVVVDLESAVSRLRRYDLAGRKVHEYPLPGMGSVSSVHGNPESDVVTVIYGSFVQPPTAMVFDGDGEGWHPAPVALPAGFDPAKYEIRQEWFASKDGQQVSMFIVHEAGIELDGSLPCYLTGYGGFNVARGSDYLPELPFWLANGGIFALPNLRGGSEYGAPWHEAGMLDNKQNTFNDAIAAAEFLIERGYTSKEHLGIAGGSNGGLLVGAAITQRPDLFRAGISKVPLLDMLRYHLFRIGRLWIPEYGSPDNPGHFAWLIDYSPCHNVTEGVRYPAMLLTLGENDSRVDPMHARKMAAALQHATASGPDQPVLLRPEADAGHGQGKPLWMRVAESADLWGFMAWQLGLEVKGE